MLSKYQGSDELCWNCDETGWKEGKYCEVTEFTFRNVAPVLPHSVNSNLASLSLDPQSIIIGSEICPTLDRAKWALRIRAWLYASIAEINKWSHFLNKTPKRLKLLIPKLHYIHPRMLEYECLKVRLEKMLPHIRECQKKWNIPPRAKLGGKVGKFLWGEKGALHPKAGGEANFCNIVRILTLRFWKSGLINDFWTITMGEEVYSYYRRKGEGGSIGNLEWLDPKEQTGFRKKGHKDWSIMNPWGMEVEEDWVFNFIIGSSFFSTFFC